MVLQRCPKNAETSGHDQYRRDPERMEAVFGFPHPTSTSGQSKGNAVVKQVTPDLSRKDTKPQRKRDYKPGSVSVRVQLLE